MIFDVAIIGGGPAGLSAAMYAGRMGLKTALFDDKVGGTIVLTDIVENYPGFKSTTGAELAKRMREHAMVYHPEVIQDRVEIAEQAGKCFMLKTRKNKYRVKSIILATGTKWRKLGVPGEEKLSKRGVHYCAVCDGPLYKGKVVAMIGGADSAAKEGLFLASIAKKVYIIYRGKKIHPEPINLERVNKNKKIEVITSTNVTEFIGDKKLEKVKLDKKYKGSSELRLDAAFIEIGHIPVTDLAKGLGVKTDKNGEIIVDKLMQTNVPGFFAAGDITDTPFKQAITAASEGSTAAYAAYQYISKEPLCTPDGKPLKAKK